MPINLAEFLSNEDGAVTVDWVVLTAAVVGLGAIAYASLSTSFQHVDSQTGSALANIEIRRPNF
ncbi:hypothetical protein E1297_15070 [Roseibium sp. RKSG952]|nr:hypothetical protein [Ruegeria arenilitoris]MTH97312.1 hypothetical protein [Roseibium sp. RKSG952]